MLLETTEFLVLVRRNKIACDRSVARDRHGLTLGQHSIAAKVPRELRSGDDVSHMPSLLSRPLFQPNLVNPIYAIYVKNATRVFCASIAISSTWHRPPARLPAQRQRARRVSFRPRSGARGRTARRHGSCGP